MIPLVTIAKLHAVEGKEADAQVALHECQLQTHNEPGCRLYAPHRDESDPRTFVMVEGWDWDGALQDHLDSPHLAVLIAKSNELFDGPADIVRLQALAVGDAAKGQL